MHRNSQTTTLKKQVYLALNDLPDSHGAARFFGIALLALIIANALLVGVGNFNHDTGIIDFLAAFNIVSTAVFGIEYVLRLWTSDMLYTGYGPARSRLRYVRSVMGIIDLLSFLPMALLWLVPYSAALVDAIRIIRLVRLVKVSRYMRGLKTIGIVFEKRQREIVAAFMVLALVCIASSVLMYEAEHAAQPEEFDSVLTGIYWAMTTMTSTGYGDLVPITPLGRLIGFFTMALSICVVAIPAGIFAAGFVEEFRNSDKSLAAEGRRPEDAESPTPEIENEEKSAPGK